MRIRYILVILVIVFFLFPTLSGISWPENFMPTEIGDFFHRITDYWVKLLKSAAGQ